MSSARSDACKHSGRNEANPERAPATSGDSHLVKATLALEAYERCDIFTSPDRCMSHMTEHVRQMEMALNEL